MPRTPVGIAAARQGPGLAPGERLAGAFASVESFPVSIDARDRLVAAAAADQAAELTAAIQSDLGLTMAVIRAANRGTAAGGGVATVPQAVKSLKPSGVLAAAANTPTYDPLGIATVAEQINQRLRAHALATQAVADSICSELGSEDRAEAALASLLHDIGRLIMIKLHPDYDFAREAPGRTPEQRIRAERERYGIDHALAGGVLARRWELPNRLAVAVERHHKEDVEGLAAVVALADQVAHLRNGDAVSFERLEVLSDRVGLTEQSLRKVVDGHASLTPTAGDAGANPCPLSERERDALAKLAEGKVYKQIADDLNLSVSTVRTHLHNIYRKLEVVDRAQAVIKAREEGWI